MGGVQNGSGNSGEEGGAYVKFPPWWGYGYFLELHNTYTTQFINSTIITSKNIERYIYTDINLAFIVLPVFFTPNKGMGLNLL